MIRRAALALFLTTMPAAAQNEALLNFNIAGLCDWQNSNNGMDVAECTGLENDAQKTVAEREAKADAKRREACMAEARNYSGDSGFASYTVYAGCLKDGPGGL